MVPADVSLPTDWLERCRAELVSADAVCGTAAPDGDVSFLHSFFALSPGVVGHSASIAGSNALFRRALFDEFSFDPTLRDGEDIALSHDFAVRGVPVRRLADLVVEHRERKTFPQAAAWMIQSGRGATRQLLRHREARVPDVAFAGWVISLAVAAGARRRSGALTTLPAIFTATAATAHVVRSFEVREAEPATLLLAILADAGMCTLYFIGRGLGFGKTTRRWVLERHRAR